MASIRKRRSLLVVLVLSISTLAAEVQIDPPRHAFIQGEKFYIRLDVAKKCRVVLSDWQGRYEYLVATMAPGEQRSVWIDTLDLRPGEYHLFGVETDVTLRIVPPKGEHLRIGFMSDLPDVLSAAQHGADFVVFPVGHWLFDKALARGLFSVPLLQIHTALSPRWNPDVADELKAAGLAEADWASLFGQVVAPSLKMLRVNDGYYPCPRSKVALRYAEPRTETLLSKLDHPGIEAVALDADYGLKMLPSGEGLTCFCQWCRGHFLIATGQEPPELGPRPPGLIAGDPYLLWDRCLGHPGPFSSPSVELFNASLKEHCSRPAVQLPGGYRGELDAVVAEAVVNGTGGENAGLWLDLARAQMRQPRPLWLMVSEAADEAARRRAGVVGAFRGASRILFRGSMPTAAPELRLAGLLGARLEAENAPVGLLASRTADAFQQLIDFHQARDLAAQGKTIPRHSKHLAALELAYAALLRSGIPFRVVLEDDIPQGLSTVILVGIDHLPADLPGRLAGVQLLADRGTRVGVNARPIDFDFSRWNEKAEEGAETGFAGLAAAGADALRRALPSAATFKLSDSNAVLLSGRAGKLVYLLLLNGAAEPRSVRIGLPSELSIYDGEPRGKGTGICTKLALDALIAVTDAPPAKLELAVAYNSLRITTEVRVLDENGSPMDGPFPVQINLRDSRDELSPLSGLFVLTKGKLAQSFLIAANDPRGRWTVAVTVPIFGLKSSATVNLDGPKERKSFLGIF